MGKGGNGGTAAVKGTDRQHVHEEGRVDVDVGKGLILVELLQDRPKLAILHQHVARALHVQSSGRKSDESKKNRKKKH
eukprot:scaffold24606_cov17-Prasinocladus_malaysianus.AAC.1